MAKKMKPEFESGKPMGHGQELYAKVKARKMELEKSLASEQKKLPPGEPYTDPRGIATALAVVEDLLTGDLSDIREPTASNLSRWLESSRHLPPSHPINEPPKKSKSR